MRTAGLHCVAPTKLAQNLLDFVLFVAVGCDVVFLCFFSENSGAAPSHWFSAGAVSWQKSGLCGMTRVAERKLSPAKAWKHLD